VLILPIEPPRPADDTAWRTAPPAGTSSPHAAPSTWRTPRCRPCRQAAVRGVTAARPRTWPLRSEPLSA